MLGCETYQRAGVFACGSHLLRFHRLIADALGPVERVAELSTSAVLGAGGSVSGIGCPRFAGSGLARDRRFPEGEPEAEGAVGENPCIQVAIPRPLPTKNGYLNNNLAVLPDLLFR